MRDVKETSKRNYEIISEMKTLQQENSAKGVGKQANFIISVGNVFNPHFATIVAYQIRDLGHSADIAVQDSCAKLKTAMC